MHFYTYKITNLINGKIYIGVHKTKNLEDGYMGSGKILNRAKEKYGIENFHKEILMFHDSESDMFEIEELIVDRNFIDRRDTYNLKIGGQGGWDYINRNLGNGHFLKCANNPNSRRAFIEAGKAHNTRIKIDPNYKLMICSKISNSLKVTFSKTGGAWVGKKHKSETIEKVKNTFVKINHQKGEKNSQFGKMWIYSLELKQSKRIYNHEKIPNGWVKGRKIFK